MHHRRLHSARSMGVSLLHATRGLPPQLLCGAVGVGLRLTLRKSKT